ncbi:MAG: hypothetical protein ABR511_13935 [Acidimicrobiales bacterium]
MRTRVSVLLTVMLASAGALLAIGPTPAGAQLVTAQPFAAYGDGTALSVNALNLGGTTVAGVHAAFAGASVNSTGISNTINDEFGQAVQPPLAGKNSYGRGVALDVGLVTPTPQATDVNQLHLAALVEAAAPPPTALITRDVALNLAPIASASLLRGQAQAVFDPATCTLGQPMSFGRGYASNLQLVGTGAAAAVSTNVAANNVSESRTFTYLIPNGDGTFGVVSETHQLIAPISLLGGAVTIEVGGPIVMRAIATGKPGGARIEFPTPPQITVLVGGVPLVAPVTFGSGGINIPINLPGVANINISLGAPPHVLGTPGSLLAGSGGVFPGSPDGTTVSGAADAVGRVQASLLNVNLLDLGIGHTEAAVQVPAGGVHCNIPVAKAATPNPAHAGEDVTWTISIPSDPAFFARLIDCDLLNIKATDTHSVLSGNPRFTLVSADHGGVISGNTVTWDNLGTYHRGDPPIVLTVVGHVVGGTGVLQDIANVTANLGNCTGGAAGTDITGSGIFNNVALTGAITLRGPEVQAGNLAATGGDSRYLVLGGLLLLGALELRRRTRGGAAARPADTVT